MRRATRGLLRRVGGLAMAAVLVASHLLGALSPVVARAESEVRYFYNNYNGDVGPFNAETFGCYQDMNDAGSSGVAYCMDGTKHGPGEQRYTRTGNADVVLSYIIANGYPNTTAICGHSLSAGEARGVTQCAVWYHRDYDLADQGISGRQRELYLIGVQLAKEAEAYAAAGGATLGCGTVWYTSEDRQQILLASKPCGSIRLGKSSADTTVSGSNPLYSLAGAEYGVYSDEACGNRVATITTDGDGNGTADGLAPGGYWVRETKPSLGYALDSTAHPVTVRATAEAKAGVTEVPQSNPLGVVVAKVDSQTGGTAQGDATLAGAEFRVDYYAGSYSASNPPSKPTRSWVLRTGADGTATLDRDHLVSGGGLYLDSKGRPIVPLGMVVVTETKAPEGYLLTDTSAHVVPVTAKGTAEAVFTYVAPKVPDDVIRGGMSLAKRDLELDGTTPQGDASLDATYTICNRSAAAVTVGGASHAPGEAVWTGTADPDDGSLSTPADLLPYGTYEVRESAPATGYLPDEGWSWTFEVREDGANYSPGGGQHNSDLVIRGGLDVAKQDRETLRFRPLGGATLEGAELTVYNASERAVLVCGKLVHPGDACLTLSTDAAGAALCAADSLPYGTYVVRETKAPTGYLLNDQWSRTFEVREDGSVALLNTIGDAADDQVIRGDLHLVKVRERGMARLSGVPFLVTSKTTGEAHVVVTDANGQIDTSSSWNPHSQRTNANDEAVSGDGAVDESALDPDAGVWFTGATDVTTEPIDSLGALPFDTYEVRELRVAANEGLELATFEVTVSRHGPTWTVAPWTTPRARTSRPSSPGARASTSPRATTT